MNSQDQAVEDVMATWHADANNPLVQFKPNPSDASFLVDPQSPFFVFPQNAYEAVHERATELYTRQKVYMETQEFRDKIAELSREKELKLVPLLSTLGHTPGIAKFLRDREGSASRRAIFLDALREIIREYEIFPRVRNGVEDWDLYDGAWSALSFRLREKCLTQGVQFGHRENERLIVEQCKTMLEIICEDDPPKGVHERKLEIWEEAQKERPPNTPTRTGIEYCTMNSAIDSVWKEFGCPEMKAPEVEGE